MPGLLSPEDQDRINNDGLLGLGMGLLSASGPSRVPISLGQALGMGAAGMQQSRQQAEMMAYKKKMMEQQAQENAMRNQILTMQMSAAQQEAARQQAFRDNYAKLMGSGQQPDRVVNEFGGGMSVAGGQIPEGAMIQRSKPIDPYEAAAKAYEMSGDPMTALEIRKKAKDAGPKVKSWEKVMIDGKAKYAPLFDDGTSGEPMTYAAAEKLHFANLGGKTVGVDAFSGAPVAQYANTMTPDAIASNAVARGNLSIAQQRLDMEKGQQRLGSVQNVDGVGLVRVSPNSNEAVPITMGGKPIGSNSTKMTEDQAKATGWLVQATNAYKNMQGAIKSNPDAAKPGFNDAIAAIPSFGIGGAIGNSMRSENRQSFIQGASSLSEALLRAATGAGVNKDEAEQKVRELTPQFGDSDKLIEQKMASIPLYIESLRVRSGPGANRLDEIMTKGAQPASGVIDFNDLRKGK